MKLIKKILKEIGFILAVLVGVVLMLLAFTVFPILFFSILGW